MYDIDNWDEDFSSENSSVIRLSDLCNYFNISNKVLYGNQSAEFYNFAIESHMIAKELINKIDKSENQWRDAAISSRESYDYEDKMAYEEVKKIRGKEIISNIKQIIDRIILAITNAIKSLITYVKGKIALKQSQFYETHKNEIGKSLRSNGERIFKGALIKGGRKNINKDLITIITNVANFWINDFQDTFDKMPEIAIRTPEDIELEEEFDTTEYEAAIFFLERKLVKIITGERARNEKQLSMRDYGKLIRKTIYEGEDSPTIDSVEIIKQYPNPKCFDILKKESLTQTLKLVNSVKKLTKEIKYLKRYADKKYTDNPISKKRLRVAKRMLTIINSMVLGVLFTIMNVYFKERAYAFSALKKII